MTSITFFFFLIPILAILLLAINFLFATHSPYQEKNSVFECGFHSFLGQNRMQFNISFYIFGLLFLLFDLEILLIYPYPVSAQFNSLYGLCIMLIFFLILTLGFAFELGKNALKIDSRQYDDNNIVYKSNTILQSKLINWEWVYWISLVIYYYILIHYCMYIPSSTVGGEVPIDIEYLKNLIFSVEELMREKGLDQPYRLLDSDQHLAKLEAEHYIRGCVRDINELKQKAIETLAERSQMDWASYNANEATNQAASSNEAANQVANANEATNQVAKAADDLIEIDNDQYQRAFADRVLREQTNEQAVQQAVQQQQQAMQHQIMQQQIMQQQLDMQQALNQQPSIYQQAMQQQAMQEQAMQEQAMLQHQEMFNRMYREAFQEAMQEQNMADQLRETAKRTADAMTDSSDILERPNKFFKR